MKEWKLSYDNYDPQAQPLREALCTLGNAYFATRGAAEEASAEDPHYPGTYLAGGYNRLSTELSGKTIENEDLVNWPNWLPLSFRQENGDWFHIDQVEILDFYQELNFKRGTLERRVRFRDSEGRETSLDSLRFVSMANPHLAGIQWILTPENWSGTIEVRSGLDGNVINAGVKRYRKLSSKHLEFIASGPIDEEAVYLHVRTCQSHIGMAMGSRTRTFLNGTPLPVERKAIQKGSYIGQTFSLEAQKGESLKIKKVVCVYTSKDEAISEPENAACKVIQRAFPFDTLLKHHEQVWSALWRRCDIQLRGQSEEQRVLRFNIFHLLQTVSYNTVGLDVGVPARGLHGEAYRGHIFWDEIFIFPFMNLRVPEVTRELLKYRFRRLHEAHHAALAAGYQGAMYPWQSGSDGREESQVLHLNPKSGRWNPDHTHLQRHISAAIAYNIWQYFQATRDLEFLLFYGGELFLEIARFWSSIATYNPEIDRFEIHRVMGPDEYHDAYPGAPEAGLKNNTYTNIMVVWIMKRALQMLEMAPDVIRKEFFRKLEIDDQEVNRWKEISKKMKICCFGDGILAQFEGYENLQEFPWEEYRKKYGDIQRLDRILEAEGLSPNDFKVSKQADVLMLFYLFSTEELEELITGLGYQFKPNWIPKNIEYYRHRTSDGSTLSRVVSAWVLSRLDRGRSWKLFQDALYSDIRDIQGGTTSEGIHLGAMAGSVDLIQRCYTGIELREGILWLNPDLPDELKELRFPIYFRNHWIQIHLTQQKFSVSFYVGWEHEVKVGVRGKIYTFKQGETKEFPMNSST
ncbi:MAG: glycosyl hydrolase family 65 protein [bacterium]|nr:glycosyl hydrolase family 65 protein [bacterium]